MKYRKLGKSNIEASTIALGTWAIGGWMWGGTDKNQSIKAIHSALDNGINLIDTAPVYGFGISEDLVGEAVKDRRDKVILATKCGLVWNTDKGEFVFSSNNQSISSENNAPLKVHRYLAPQSIRKEVEDSLKRLNTDYIDLYQTHWQDPTTPIEDSMAELLKLKDEGKIRAIGACNASVEEIEKYKATGQLDSDQERLSMLDLGQKQGKLPYLIENKTAFLAFSPLALGLLTGKIGPNTKFATGDQRNFKERFHSDNLRKAQVFISELKSISEDLKIPLTQMVLAWTINQPGVTHALVGARNEIQARENAQAADIELDTETLAKINEVVDKYSGTIV